MRIISARFSALLLVCYMLSSSVCCSDAAAQSASRNDPARNLIIKNIHFLVNQKRSIMSMAPLVLNDTLSKLAQEHSNAMAVGRTKFGHDGFSHRAEKARRILESPTGGVGENVTLADDAEEAVESWWTSEGHQANITGAYTHTGIGATQQNGHWYCTQIFINK